MAIPALRWRRCGPGPGPMHPGDRAVADAFLMMLAARKQPRPWTPGDDVAVQVRGCVEGARTQAGMLDDSTDTLAVVLVDAGSGDPPIGRVTADRFLILGAWDPAYQPLTHAAGGVL
jgi:hypothetical protein